MLAVSIDTEPGTAESLFEAEGYVSTPGFKNWDVGEDGRFLMMKPVPADYFIVVHTNWFEELKERVPVP